MKIQLLLPLLLIATSSFAQQQFKAEIKNKGFIDISSSLNREKVTIFDLNTDSTLSIKEIGRLLDIASRTKRKTKIKDNTIHNTKLSYLLNEIEEKDNNSITVLSPHEDLPTIYKRQKKNIKIIAINRLIYQSPIIYFQADHRGIDGVLMTQSIDSEKNWRSPTIAVKHNKNSIKGWGILSDSRKRGESLFMLLSDDKNYTYLSKSQDKGLTWSYPFNFSNEVKGTDFKISAYKKIVYLLFKATETTSEYNKGDILLWYSDIQEFLKEKSDGVMIRIAQAKDNKGNIAWGIYAISKDKVIIFKQNNDKKYLELFSLYHDNNNLEIIY